MIPDAAVEAAAMAGYEARTGLRWSGLDMESREAEEFAAQCALEAVAPYMTGRVVDYLDEATARISNDPDVADYERGIDDATRGMAAKVKRLLNGDAK